MNINAYLTRIHYAGPVDVSLETLQNLHYQHLLSIPLENLDIHYGRDIVLDTDVLFTKLITKKRGGFCYELNGLFCELLRAIGFTAKLVSGQVFEPGKGFNDEFDHAAIIVHLNGIDWLVDVGFGRRFPLYPIAIQPGEIQEDRTGLYTIRSYNAAYWVIQYQNETGNWVPAYLFTTVSRQLTDFRSMCRYHQTSSASYFTQNMLCTLVTPNGRITLTDDKLKITEQGRVTEQPVDDADDFEYLLETHFGIRMSWDIYALRPEVLLFAIQASDSSYRTPVNGLANYYFSHPHP
ncbi:arylamine N-acetyltransferase family protein [Spirosoma aerolatum]|uniref:arylamine N-acetyltransferase family protein n=1 Tax=Spirosoma aerolatum TaxID=1211326 RepID=UPI0009AE858E|nr:arylamine N-acetyltransferase [Spirosoma aerolatum]